MQPSSILVGRVFQLGSDCEVLTAGDWLTGDWSLARLSPGGLQSPMSQRPQSLSAQSAVLSFFRMLRVSTALLIGTLLLPADSTAQVRVHALDGAALVDPFAAPAGTKAIVFLFTSTDCPISNRYAPEVRRLAETFGAQGVVFRLVYPNPAEAAPAIREHMAAFAYAGAAQALRDPEHALVKARRRDGHARGGGLRGWAPRVSRPHRRSLRRSRPRAAVGHETRSRGRAGRRRRRQAGRAADDAGGGLFHR